MNLSIKIFIALVLSVVVGLVIGPEGLPFIKLWIAPIGTIFINLIKNALQAGAKHINIAARMGKEDDVIVRVANDGEPIPASAQEQIFIPFYTTKKEGSGIGLSISRQIMRNHNGSIELVQSDDRQTVFELRFR